MGKAKRIRPKKKWLIWMGAVVLGTLGLWAISMAFVGPESDQQRGGGAKVNAIKPKGGDTVGGIPKTQSYNQRVREQDQLLAEQAKKEGKSIVPTVMGEQKSRPNNVKKVEPPKKIEGPKQPPKKTRSSKKKPKESAKIKQYKASVQKDIQKILALGVEHQPHSTVAFYQPDKNGGTPDKNTLTSTAANQTEETKELPPLPFESGDILYSANVIALNSDVPSPVVAKIVSGAAKNTQFFGKFTRHGKHMLLRFNRLKDPYGNEYPIEAIALDMDTSSAAVRSRVDSHYMERWGGLIAASFLEGFGEAVEKSGQSFESSDTRDTFTYPEYDADEQAWIAAGKVGSRLAGIMEKNFDRPPTVYTDHDELFGIMILSTTKR